MTVNKFSIVYVLMLLLFVSCDCKLKTGDVDDDVKTIIEVQRYDRLQSMYLTTADFAALQQMETNYPMETRALIENVLMLGPIDSPDINKKFLAFYQDSTLQTILSDAEAQYANIDDVNKKLNDAIARLRHDVPGIPIPRFYTQVGALGQSIIVGDESDWDGIDHAKCMRFVKKGLALPIGNLTSQLFSNVYMNPFDQFVKRDILCRHYGRYVDDSDMIDPDRAWLLAQVPKVREYLADELGLELHMGKLHIQEIHGGVEFLGTFVKPYRDYVSNKTLERIKGRLQQTDLRNGEAANRTICSYLGILSHTASYNLRREIFDTSDIAQIVEFDADMTKSKLIAV